MTDGRSALPPPVREAVTRERMDVPRPQGLAPADLDALVDIVLGKRRSDEPIRLDLAVRVLSGGADRRAAARALERVLVSRDIGTTGRVIAAQELGMLAASDAVSVLLGAAGDDDPRVRQAAFAALGRFGGRDVLEELTGASEMDPAARRQLNLTRALIVHREGLDGPFLPEARPAGSVDVDAMDETTLALSPAAAKDGSDSKQIAGGTFGLDVAASGYELRCGAATWTLLLNREIAPKGVDAERVFERPWVAGLLARWSLGGRASTVQHLVLTRPLGKSTLVDVVRTDGRVTYTGNAQREASGASFVIEDADGAAVPSVHVEGHADANGITIDRAATGTTRKAVRRTESVFP